MAINTHLKWAVTYHFIPSGSNPKIVAPITGVTECWKSADSTSFRFEYPVYDESGTLNLHVREVILQGRFAIIQDYDCRPVGSTKAWDVCFIQVIPTLVNSVDGSINTMQYPWDSYYSRELFAGRIAKSRDGIKAEVSEKQIVHKNWIGDVSRVKDSVVTHAQIMKANKTSDDTWQVGVSVGSKLVPSVAYLVKVDEEGKVTRFEYQDVSSQAKGRLLNSMRFDAKLLVKDDQTSPVNLRQKARVFDFRLCPPVRLNSFPDKSCPPKTYMYDGRIKTITELQGLNDAMLPSDSPSPNGLSPWLIVPLGLFAGLLLSALLKRRKFNQ